MKKIIIILFLLFICVSIFAVEVTDFGNGISERYKGTSYFRDGDTTFIVDTKFGVGLDEKFFILTIEGKELTMEERKEFLYTLLSSIEKEGIFDTYAYMALSLVLDGTDIEYKGSSPHYEIIILE